MEQGALFFLKTAGPGKKPSAGLRRGEKELKTRKEKRGMWLGWTQERVSSREQYPEKKKKTQTQTKSFTSAKQGSKRNGRRGTKKGGKLIAGGSTEEKMLRSGPTAGRSRVGRKRKKQSEKRDRRPRKGESGGEEGQPTPRKTKRGTDKTIYL